MRKSRFTEAQIIGMIKEQEAGMPTAEVCRRHGLSPSTFYKLKAKYGSMEVSEAARLKALEDENAKLKRLLADTMLDNVVLKIFWERTDDADQAARGSAQSDAGSRHLARRACRLVGVDPKTVRRECPPDYPEIRKEMQEIAGKRRRFGYRRIGVMLERKGMIMNHKKLYRLYREEELSVKRRRGRKRARGTRTPMPEAARPNARWSLDFLSDSFGASRKFRILAVIDDCCRENLCLMADTSISGARVARELDALVRVYGKPGCIVSDNGTEFTSRAIPGRKQRTTKVKYDKRRYKRRNRIEIMFGRLKDWRRVATRYDCCPKVFLSAIALAAVVIYWL